MGAQPKVSSKLRTPPQGFCRQEVWVHSKSGEAAFRVGGRGGGGSRCWERVYIPLRLEASVRTETHPRVPLEEGGGPRLQKRGWSALSWSFNRVAQRPREHAGGCTTSSRGGGVQRGARVGRVPLPQPLLTVGPGQEGPRWGKMGHTHLQTGK